MHLLHSSTLYLRALEWREHRLLQWKADERASVLFRVLSSVQFWQRGPEEMQRTGLFYLSYQCGAHRQAAHSPPSAPFLPHNHLDTQNTPTTSNMFNNHPSLQPALIASFIPIYFCHLDNLRDCTVESGGAPSGLRPLVSILSWQSFLLSSISGGDFNQMTSDRGIKYLCDWQPACLWLRMQRGWRQTRRPR